MSDFARRKTVVLEMDSDRCQNTYGVSPCTAGRKDSGTAQAGSATTITLRAGASAVDDAYNGMTVRLTGGTGAGQERVVTDYVGASKVATVDPAWTTTPDATSIYDVIDRPGACYNTWATCQDKPNYLRGTKTRKFCTAGAPIPAGQTIRPYITRNGVETMPTEIDLEKGLAPRGSVRIALADPVDSDIEDDPYHASRAAAAGGTYWPRFLARNPNYAGRFAKLRTARLTAGWDESEFVDELYVVDRIDPPDTRGVARVTLKDPSKLADRAKIPAPSEGKLAADITAATTNLAMEAGDGADYPSSGFVRIGDEVIEYATREVSQGWSLNGSTDGWTGNDVTVTVQTHSLLLEGTGASPYVLSPSGLAITGGIQRWVAARIKRVAGAGWNGNLAYATAGHGFSASYYKNIADPTGGAASDWVVALWDMHDLSVGGTDWKDSTITQLRIELGSGATDDFEVDWVAYSETAPAAADVLALPDTGYRARFNTAASDHAAGDAVQLCQVWQAARVHEVLTDLCSAAGLAATNIDSAGFQAEDDKWLGTSFTIDAEITEPTKISDLLAELVGDVGGVLWWSPSAQKMTFEVIAPRAPNEAPVIEITEAAHILEKSVKVERLEDLRITVAGIVFDPLSATADLGDPVTYLRGEIGIDQDARSANEYGDDRIDLTRSRWWSDDNAAAVFAAVGRRLGRYRDAPQRITLSLDGKDDSIKVGDLVDLAIRQIVDFAGNPKPVRAIVTRRRDKGHGIELRLRATNLGARYAFFAPAGAADYPGDPDYAHFAPDSNGFPADGSRPYIFF